MTSLECRQLTILVLGLLVAALFLFRIANSELDRKLRFQLEPTAVEQQGRRP